MKCSFVATVFSCTQKRATPQTVPPNGPLPQRDGPSGREAVAASVTACGNRRHDTEDSVAGWYSSTKGEPEATDEAGAIASAFYFTPYRNVLEMCSPESQPVEAVPLLEVRPMACKSWFCPHCCVGKGLKVRQDLGRVLRSFKHLMMVTLTVDPKLFETPEEAHEYVRKKVAVNSLVKSLFERGYLKTRRYFAVREFQRDTEMEHYHVLLESSYIPFQEIADLWGRFRPKTAPPRQGNEPEFGHVRFSAPRFASQAHAANYACKYLIKHPEHGYPEWVVNRKNHVRYTTSQGFWKSDQPDEQFTPAEHDNIELQCCDDACFCASCRGIDPEELQAECVTCGRPVELSREEAVEYRDELQCCTCATIAPIEDQKKRQTCVQQRVSKCGKTSVIVEVTEEVTRGGEIVKRRRYVQDLPMSIADVAKLCGVAEGTRSWFLPYRDLARLQEHLQNEKNQTNSASSQALATITEAVSERGNTS